MKVDGKDLRPIWIDRDLKTVKIIDQRLLPHELVIRDVKTADGIIEAIQTMQVRGAPLIGVTGAYGMYLAALNHPGEFIKNDYIARECERIKSARPTAVNLAWAADRVLDKILAVEHTRDRVDAARNEAGDITEEEADNCKKIGEHGLGLIQAISRAKEGRTVNILTHCNAGWLACIEWGTATAPIYMAYEKGIDIHVWVDETRPLNQGARLTAWELGKYGVHHTVIIDNASGYLMQQGMVDMVIVGSDRTTCTGDVANKIGTYHKALAAHDNDIPFYAAMPSSTIDWELKDGIKEIPIEQRDPDEIRYVQGLYQGEITSVLVPPADSPAMNIAFDVTPARLVTGIITERGVCRASAADIKKLFPEKMI